MIQIIKHILILHKYTCMLNTIDTFWLKSKFYPYLNSQFFYRYLFFSTGEPSEKSEVYISSRWANKTQALPCSLTSSSSKVKTSGWGLAWRWSRSLCPKEWCEWIWAMPQQCLWPSRGSFPALMFLRDWDTSGYSAVCWGVSTEKTTVSTRVK